MKNVLLILALLFAFRAGAAETIRIEGPIHPMSGLPVLTMLAQQKEEPIVSILIESGGGQIEVARAIASAIEDRTARGLTTNCYALRAMSAAFFIMSHCTNRFVAPYGKFMMCITYSS